MNSKCCAAVIFTFFTLLYLYQAILAIFIVPIYSDDCNYNDFIPKDSPVQLSMNDYIYGSMVSSIIMMVLLAASGKYNSNSDCAHAFIGIVYLIYNLFIWAWSIVGITVYYNYNEDACSDVEGYNMIMTLGLYSNLVASSIILTMVVVAICLYCKHGEEKIGDHKERLVEERGGEVIRGERPEMGEKAELEDAKVNAKGANANVVNGKVVNVEGGQ